jgi:glycosyltransferase involved in cell wall biosynthesis
MEFVLTSVIPVIGSATEMKYLKKTLSDAHGKPIKVVSVCDLIEEFPSDQIKDLLSEACPKCVLVVTDIYGGPGQARNAGLQFANTRWIAFWDSDDNPNIQPILEEISKNDNAEIIVGAYETIDSQAASVRTSHESSENLFGVALNPGLWRMLFKRSIIERDFPEYKMGEDQVFLIRNEFYEKKIIFTQTLLYSYSLNNSSQLTKNEIALNDLLLALTESTKKLKYVPIRFSPIVGLMAFRQFITIQKKCSLRYKINSYLIVIQIPVNILFRRRVAGHNNV